LASDRLVHLGLPVLCDWKLIVVHKLGSFIIGAQRTQLIALFWLFRQLNHNSADAKVSAM